MRDVFKSEPRTAQDFAEVFELDGESGYFSLYEMAAAEGSAMTTAIRVLIGESDLTDDDFVVAWNRQQHHVALIIKGQIWSVFDA